MSPPAPHLSPLDKAKAEINELNQTMQADLDSLRSAPITELEKRINSLRRTFHASQQSAITNIKNAFNGSDMRIYNLENDLRAEKALLVDAHKGLQAEKALTGRLTTELSAEKEAAKVQYTKLKAELDSARDEIDEGMSRLQKAQNELDKAERARADIQTDLEAAKQRNVDLQKQSAAAEQGRKELLNEFTSVRKHEARLQAELRTAKERLSALENGLNALVGTNKQQLCQARPASASAPVNNHQNSSAEDSNDRPQGRGHHIQVQAVESQPANSMSDDDPDYLLCQEALREVMDPKNRQYNRHFLKPVDMVASDHRTNLNATMQPMNLDTIKEKLDKGAYNSANSFKADFDLLIANSRELDPPGNHVRVAGEQLLAIFQEQWSAPRTADHGSPDRTSLDQQSRGHKRKASTEHPVPPEGAEAAWRSPSLPLLNDHATQSSGHSSDGRPDIHQSRSQQASGSSAGSAETAMGLWEGQLMAGSNIQVDTKVDVIIKRDHFAKPVNTFHVSCKDLFPDKLEVQGHVAASWLEDEIQRLDCDPDRDMVLFLVSPATDNDTIGFRELDNSFTSNERVGTVKHADGYNVDGVYLVPTKTSYRSIARISRLTEDKYFPDRGREYSKHDEDYRMKGKLLLVVLFRLEEAAQEQIRLAWDAAIKAVRSPDLKDLTGVRNHLKHYPLPIFHPWGFCLSGYERDTLIYTTIVVYSQSLAELHMTIAYPQGFFQLWHSKINQSEHSSIDGVKLPRWVFVLGQVISPLSRWEYLIVDIEHDDRPLWGITSKKTGCFGLGDVIMLVSSKFPSSLEEWQSTITVDHRKNQTKKRIHLPGLSLQEYRIRDGPIRKKRTA